MQECPKQYQTEVSSPNFSPLTMTPRPILFRHCTGSIEADPTIARVQPFHAQLPNFAKTPLHSLDDLSQGLGVKSVFVKDESDRLGLPAFKILGASWGCFRAIIVKLHLLTESSLDEVARAAKTEGIVLYTASAGNHGRALAAMARILGVPAHIYVPNSTGAEAVRRIESEGAVVTRSQLDYDGAVMEAWAESETKAGGLFVQDASFEGYHDIPRWIVQGYSTMLSEVEEQLAEQGLEHGLVVTPVGVGSLAHAVVRHCKSGDRQCAVMTVEPDTASCLYASLKAGRPTSVPTIKTIMEGLNCGTVSADVFQDLSTSVDACATVSDFEAHQAVQYLATKNIASGPCGGATVAALRKLAKSDQRPAWLTKDTVVVILSTEGPRLYDAP
jgi:diaminopropionate ammonia-lyase family